MSSQHRKQILENCRWLFGQEVKLVTFAIRKHLKGPQNLDDDVDCDSSELHYYAIVLPKDCSLKSFANLEIEEKILLKETHLLSSDGAITKLLEAVEGRIGIMIETDSENNGRIRIRAPDTIEDGLAGKKTIQYTTNQSSSVLTAARAQLGTLPNQQKLHLPPVSKNLQPAGMAAPISSPGGAVSEPSMRFFDSLKRCTEKLCQGENAKTDMNKYLTEVNLALLDGGLRKEGEREGGRRKEFPREIHTAIKTPEDAPEDSFNSDIECDLKPGDHINQSSMTRSSQFEHNVTKTKRKLHTPEALINTSQPYHFKLLSTPTDEVYCESPSPIMTPTTSAESDSTHTSRQGSITNEPGLSDATRAFIKAEIKLALEQQLNDTSVGTIIEQKVPTSEQEGSSTDCAGCHTPVHDMTDNITIGDNRESTIIIDKIRSSVTIDDLVRFFSGFGKVKSAKKICFRAGGMGFSKSTGIVEFNNVEDAEKARFGYLFGDLPSSWYF